jgi:Pvc16 N-terminal domain
VSNILAIATVTESLTQLLGEFLSSGGTVPGARVVHLEPNSEHLKGGSPIVNIFLYRITQNPALFNQDAPTREPSGGLVQRPRLGVNLDYLISFYGDQSTLEPQRLLGSVSAGLHAEPILSPALIARTVLASPWLTGSDLAESSECVRFTAVAVPDERFWTSTAPAHFEVSVAYQASGLELDWPAARPK